MDTLLATIILSIALTAIAGMFIQSIDLNVSASDYTVAANIARERIEDLKANWDGSASFPSESVNLNGKAYQRNTRINLRSDLDSSNRLYELAVTVDWNNHGQHQEITLTTYLLPL
ncbi:MAG TPA: hypothetical protein PKA28_00195 [Methylomusa anaerophila]|nr:hypothetical protein [Methylomusa anaerophila]HML86850.1 hypothetical protein [Methylomusa anaerophila]